MADRVRFWVDVFTKLSNTEAVLHDRDDPTLVYDVVAYGPNGDTHARSTPPRRATSACSAKLATESLFVTVGSGSPNASG